MSLGVVASGFDSILAQESHIRAAIRLEPDRADLNYFMGYICFNGKDYAGAVGYLKKAASLEPGNFYYVNLCGAAQLMAGDKLSALDTFRRAQEIDPQNIEAISNHGITLTGLGRYDEAVHDFEQCIKLDPLNPYNYNNLGITAQDAGEFGLALTALRQAVNVKPDYAQGWQNLAMRQLLTGDYKNGWKNYEWRWLNDAFTSQRRNFSQPQWKGEEDLQGLTLLVHAEQGLGDTIQFCRYISMVLDRVKGSGQVVVEVPGPLAELILDSFPGVLIIAQSSQLPEFHYHCPMLSLPGVFDTRVESIPSATSYLKVRYNHIIKWRHRLQATKPLVGLVWRGGAAHSKDHLRSISLQRLLEHLPSGVNYVSLQKDLTPDDVKTIENHPQICHYGDQLDSFSDTAALCMLMDHIVSVDTSVAHLAAALGRPVSLLLQYSPDWRWGLGTLRTPWYPTMILCRQQKLHDWDSALKQIGSTLGK